MHAPLLVVGFGSFGNIHNNPASRLARAVDGRMAGMRLCVGREVPVRYAEGPEETIALSQLHRPCAILGIGVAANRPRACVESIGVRYGDASLPDQAGIGVADLEPGGPEAVAATAPVDALAAALGVAVSADAGRYVCNAWLYRVVRRLGADLPITFLHIPLAGVEPDWLIEGLSHVWGSAGSPPMNVLHPSR